MAGSKKSTTEISSPPGAAGTARWVWLALLLIVAFNVALRWRLADLPLERDEGEYAYAGQLLLQGVPPYQAAYNMKFPGTYFAYAGILAVFGESARGIHLGLAVVTSVTTVLVFFIGAQLLSRGAALLGAISFVLLTALPAAFGLAGHATHFLTLFATAGTWALLRAEARPKAGRWLLAGLSFGLAILMKQHAVILAGAGALWIAWAGWQQKLGRATIGKYLGAFGVGLAGPLIITALGLAAAGVWEQFTFWTMQYATQYASAVSLRAAWPGFVAGFGPIWQASWPLWLLAGLGLGVLGWRKFPARLSVILILGLGGLLAACPGYHFRGHYFLPMLPGVALLAAVTAATVWQKCQDRTARLLVGGGLAAAGLLTSWSNRAIWFQATPAEAARQIYSLNPFLESPVVADYLRARTTPEERIAVVGSEPQIYFHAQRRSASGYIYMYALTEPLPLAQRMRDEFAREMEAAKPRYAVLVDIVPSWISLSHADTSILTWWSEFVKQYEPVGAVRMQADAPTEYFWDEAVVRTLNLAECHLLIYRRKEP
jgi:4-amino-4-deoxy-L-arabinose transferase-like glycosyltransferase